MFDFLKKQLIDVIEWQEEPGEIAWRIPFADQEIQNGAQLTVREGQMAAFLNEGKLADYFGPGLHTLETANLPVLTSLLNWDKGFKSPFKSDVVFFSLREHSGLKWGTSQPVTVRDAEIGPVRLRAFGTYSFRLKELQPFVQRVLGTLGEVTVDSLEGQLRSTIITAIATGLGGSGVPFLDLAANQQKMSEAIKAEVDKAFAQWGLSCLSFHLESVSLPEEVQAHLDKGSSMRLVGDLDKYAKFQAAEAMEKAAANPGGLGALGAGIATAGILGQTMSGAVGNAAAPAAPAEDPFALIEKLHKLVTMGALSQEEFDAKKAELLARVK